VERKDGHLYINPNVLNRDEIARDFAESTRIYPIMFDQVKTDIDRLTLKIPPTFEVASIPYPIHLENDFGEYRTEYEIQENLITYQRTLIIKELLVPQSAYKNVKSFFNCIFEEDKKFITLRKR
jgi:hypothetical protein